MHCSAGAAFAQPRQERQESCERHLEENRRGGPQRDERARQEIRRGSRKGALAQRDGQSITCFTGALLVLYWCFTGVVLVQKEKGKRLLALLVKKKIL